MKDSKGFPFLEFLKRGSPLRIATHFAGSPLNLAYAQQSVATHKSFTRELQLSSCVFDSLLDVSQNPPLNSL